MQRPSTRASVEALRQFPLFSRLTAPQFEQVAACLTPLVLQPGDHLFQAGEPFKRAIHIVQRGKLELRRKEGGVFTLGPGELIGLTHYLDKAPYNSTAMALTTVQLLALPAAELHDIEEKCPALFNAINRIIAERIRDRGTPRQITSRVLTLPARSVMKSPFVTAGADLTLRQAFEMMTSRKIGSLGVTGTDGRLLGVLTYAGLSEAVLIKGAAPDADVLKVVCETSHTVGPDAPLWQVEEIQQDHGVKYVIVAEGDRPLGMISQTDILNALIAHQGLVLAEINRAKSFVKLAAHHGRVLSVAQEARENNRRASAAVRILSEFHLALQRRCVELTLEQMAHEGLGEPPGPYALIIFGSVARKETMLNPDQDNGIILGDGPATESVAAQRWFDTLSDRVNLHLDEVGYPLCPGNIMARNVMFHKTLRQWQQQITHIAHLPTEKGARWANIVFDFDTLYGDDNLVSQLRKHVSLQLHENPRLLKLMVADDAEGRPPLGLFNRLITQRSDTDKGKGKIDIKRNGLRIIADAARIYALRDDIDTRNTGDRLAALVRQGTLSADFVASINAAYEELLDLLLSHQIQRMQTGLEVDKLIDPEGLSPLHHESLRMAMRTVKRFQEKLQTEFDLVNL